METKLLYRNQVRITQGFYKGLEGIVTDISECYDTSKYYTKYYVEMTTLKNNVIYTHNAWILEDSLEKLEYHNGMNNGSLGVL